MRKKTPKYLFSVLTEVPTGASGGAASQKSYYLQPMFKISMLLDPSNKIFSLFMVMIH